MVHGLTEGRICHYVDGAKTHRAALIVSVPRNDRHPSRANVFRPPSTHEEIEATVARVVEADDTVATAVAKVFASFLHENVPFMPAGKYEPNTFHWVEKVD